MLGYDGTMTKHNMPVPERFEMKVDRSGGPDACHSWTAGTTKGGYGSFSINSRDHVATRVQWKISYGAFDERLHVCHKCNNPNCVNPLHLYLGDQERNMQDAAEWGRMNNHHGNKTHCVNGHEFTDENTVRHGPNGKWRRCRECRRERRRQGRG